MARQLIRLRAVRAPDVQDDSLSQAEVRANNAGAVTYEQYNDSIISQIRLAEGGTAWTQSPYPDPLSTTPGGSTSTPAIGTQVVNDYLSGVQDGINTVFRSSHAMLPQTVSVWYNGVRLGLGGADDFILMPQSDASGFNTVMLTGAVPPLARDKLWADYTRAF